MLAPCLLWACAAAGPPPPSEAGGLTHGGAPASPRPECADEPRAVGRIEDAQLNEISGVVQSSAARDVFFVHNDSGDAPRFFAIDRAGHVLAELVLETVPILVDAEDIALGPAPDGHFLYLGDTGNNFASMGQGIPRRKAVVYRVPEPVVAASARGARIALRDVQPIVFTFPDGARDVEAFFIDPRNGELFMVGKQADGHSQILTADAATLAAGGGELRLAGEILFGQGGPPGAKMPTAASIARDGSAILIRTYSSVLLFPRGPSESVMSSLQRAPRQLRAPAETQGEAIGFAEGDTAFVTISEGMNPAVYCTNLPR
ncbi:MAG TPA: hypothetical protein VJN18_23575 [Polyangiaceae bacterium]|nr:hypothetical protein [Polyangiaceae bacterium]